MFVEDAIHGRLRPPAAFDEFVDCCAGNWLLLVGRLSRQLANCLLDDAPVTGFGFCIPIIVVCLSAVRAGGLPRLVFPMLGVGLREVGRAGIGDIFDAAAGVRRDVDHSPTLINRLRTGNSRVPYNFLLC